MARGVNVQILVGNLGQDPELRYTGAGTAVCNIRMATNESYKDAKGELVENVQWHSLVVWGRAAEICGEYLKKGSLLYVLGATQHRSYEDNDGNTRYVTEVKVRDFEFLGGGNGAPSGKQSVETVNEGQEEPAEDDLPF